MIQRLVKHGNCLAVVFDKGILDLLKIGPETPLLVTTDGERLRVTPATKADLERDKRFQKAADWAHKRFDKAFKRLSES